MGTPKGPGEEGLDLGGLEAGMNTGKGSPTAPTMVDLEGLDSKQLGAALSGHGLTVDDNHSRPGVTALCREAPDTTSALENLAAAQAAAQAPTETAETPATADGAEGEVGEAGTAVRAAAAQGGHVEGEDTGETVFVKGKPAPPGMKGEAGADGVSIDKDGGFTLPDGSWGRTYADPGGGKESDEDFD